MKAKDILNRINKIFLPYLKNGNPNLFSWPGRANQISEKKSDIEYSSIDALYDVLFNERYPRSVLHRFHSTHPMFHLKGLIGRDEFPFDNILAYVSMNLPIAGWGTCGHVDHLRDFLKEEKGYIYTLVSNNPKISVPNFLKNIANGLGGDHADNKAYELEILHQGDVPIENILFATERTEDFHEGKEVENLLFKYDKGLPERYTKYDVQSIASIKQCLIRNECWEKLKFLAKEGFTQLSEEELKNIEGNTPQEKNQSSVPYSIFSKDLNESKDLHKISVSKEQLLQK